MHMDTDFELLPYVGAGPITFGMSPSQVESALGIPEEVGINHLGQRVEHRSFMNVGYEAGDDGRLTHIGFGRQMSRVRYGNVMLFSEPVSRVLQSVCSEDGAPYVYLGFVVLLKLGFTLTGFHDNDRSQLAVALFPKGGWDSRLHRLKPFRLSAC